MNFYIQSDKVTINLKNRKQIMLRNLFKKLLLIKDSLKNRPTNKNP